MFIYPKPLDEFSVKQDVEKCLRRVKVKAFFHDKEDDSNTSDKDIIFSRRYRLENRSGLPQRASSPPELFPSENVVMTSINSISIVKPNFPTFLQKRGRRKKF